MAVGELVRGVFELLPLGLTYFLDQDIKANYIETSRLYAYGSMFAYDDGYVTGYLVEK